jgi:hypothetical protein
MDRMESSPPTPAPAAPDASLQRDGLTFVAWLAGSLVAACGWAWAATRLQASFAPVLLFPLLVGAAVGATTVGLARLCRINALPTLAAGAMLCGMAAVVGQHYLAYLEYRRAHESARGADPRLALVESQGQSVAPAGFLSFLEAQARRGRKFSVNQSAGSSPAGGAVWALWALDGALVVAAAGIVAWRSGPRTGAGQQR